MENKTIILLSILLAVALSSFVYADEYCFLSMSRGDKVHITETEYWVCEHTICQKCVNSSLWTAAWTKCSDACDFNSIPAPNLTLSAIFPFQNQGVYTKTTFFLDITTNQIANINLIDNVAGTQKNLCPNCREYRKSIILKEGFNNITIRATSGFQFKEYTISFFLDNKKPVISKTLPASNKYASTLFTVFYDEANLEEITIKYGNNLTGWKQAVLQNCASGRKQNCSIELSLKEYDNQQILYWFEIKDIANNIAIGRKVKINIDETNPIITSFNYNLGKTYVNFNMSVFDRNFVKIEYKNNAVINPVWKTICSSLRNNNCFKKIYFRPGTYNLDIRVSDKAGNYNFTTLDFTILN